MSTRSLIGYLNKEKNEVNYVYCHFDGYPGGVGKTLYEFYNTPILARKLVSLNGFSSLERTIEATKKEEYDDDFNNGIMEYEDYMRTNKLGAAYIYLYIPTRDETEGYWTVRPTFGYDLATLINENIVDYI